MSPYDVLYRDRDVIVVNKAPGLLSQSDRSGDPDLLTLLSRETGRPVFPVHRLDRGVGGLIVAAPIQRAAAKLSQLVANEDGAFRKEYLAVLHGRFDAESGTLTDHLLRDGGRTRVVPEGTKDAKIARLAYRVLGENEVDGILLSLVAVRLFTGRTHAPDPRPVCKRGASRRGGRTVRGARQIPADRSVFLSALVPASRDRQNALLFRDPGRHAVRSLFDPRSRGERFL